ncbi:ATP-binding protein [Algoriphagus namhaensis]
MTQKSRSWIILASVVALLLVLILNFFFFQKSEEQIFFEDVQEHISEIDAQFDQDFISILMMARPEDSISFETVQSIDHRYPFFLLNDQEELIFWSDFTQSLDFSAIDKRAEYQLLEDPYGSFLTKTRQVTRNGKQYWLIHAVRLILPGTINNDYLITGANPKIFGNNRFELFSNPAEGAFQIKSAKGEDIFGINFLFGYRPSGKLGNTTILLFFTSVFLLYFILCFDFVWRIWKSGRQWRAIGYSVPIIFGFRVLMLLVDFPGAYFSIALFDPIHYASSWINPSLGDLLINSLCVSFLVVLILLKLASAEMHEKMKIFSSTSEIRVVFYLFFGVSTLGLFLFWRLPRDLILNSQWALDVQNFPAMDWFQAISYLILFLWGAGYILMTIALSSLLASLNQNWVRYTRWLLFIAVPIGVALAFFQFWMALVWILHLIFFFIVLRFRLAKNVYKLGLDTFYTFFFASLIAAGITGFSSIATEKNQLNEAKVRFVNQNLIENDIISEFFLGEVFERIQNDLFIQNRLEDPLLSKEPIETKIRKIHLDNYFDQFEINISIFSASGNKLLGSLNSKSLSELRNEVIKSDFATTVRGLYFIRGDSPEDGNRFVGFVPLSKDGTSLGTILLELRQMNIQPTSVYPKLLLDKKYSGKLDPSRFDYAIFEEGKLLSSVGSFNYSGRRFAEALSNPNLKTSGVSTAGHHHLGIEDGNRLIVVSSLSPSLGYYTGNISLYFLLFVLLTFFTILINTLLKGYRNFEFNYSTKLQLYLNFAFFFPILIISIITLGLLANSYRADLDRQYLQKAELIRGNLSSFVGNQALNNSNRDLIDEEVVYLANTTGSELHLYTPDGRLYSTNRPNIFDKKILSKLINPAAMVAIRENNLNQFLAEERIGKLNYKSVYLPVFTGPRQDLAGILAVPFFESEAELNALIADVLSNIFNAFVVIFILFLIVSYFVSKNLTFPFKLLTQKLKSTNLEDNEPMVWSTKDEIGMLVNEYNNMLFKLDQSKQVLASTEKESAWREMAKQVAHEIKNPLTPMKLTLQHMMRLEWQGDEEEKERLKKSLNTLIHQVDALSGIASSFSTFAKMPLPKNERMNFKSVVLKVLQLYLNDDRVDLQFKDDSYTDEIPIMGDDQLFGRVITNLIINGIQSVDEGMQPLIKVWLWLSDTAVFLEITDNGKGIPEELRDKIFIPNFSTKTQGSGLGLAIAKSGVETAGGKIWFETQTDVGTTFYLTFPLAP